MAARYPQQPAAAMPIDTEGPNVDNNLDEDTYEYLEDFWQQALRRAEAGLYSSHEKGDAPPHYASHPTESAPTAAAPRPADSMDATSPIETTQLSAGQRPKERGAPSSPLPRAPPLLQQQHQQQYRQAPPQQQQQQQLLQQQQSSQRQQSYRQPPPVLRRPATSGNKNAWMKVEAQPNLKRNGYTSHKGVAWVVQ